MKIKIYIISLLLIAAGINQSFGQDPYEPNDTYETATTVTCGQQLSAYIQIIGDVDWYEIEMEESGVLEVAVTSVPSNLNIDVGIYQIINNVLTLIANDRVPYPANGDNMYSYAVGNAGTYLILIEDNGNNAYSDSDPYEMALSCTANALELNQIYEEAAQIPTDTCFEANIYGDNHTYTVYNDVDWFEVQVTSSGVLEVAITSVPSNLNLDVGIYQIIDNALTLISDDRVPYPGGGDNMFSNAVINPGTYLIKVDDDGNNAFNEETYNFCVGFTANALELNQIYEEAAPIPTDTCFEANIYGDNHTYTVYNDVDWFEVQVTSSGVLEVAVTSVANNLNLNVRIYQIIDYALTLISDDRVPYPGGGDNMFSNAVINPGTYLIKVDDDGNNAFNEETYNFCVGFTANALELNQIYEEAAPIPTDTCFEANIYGDNHTYTVYNDVDWFEVQVTSSGVLEVAVTSVANNLNLNVRIYQIIDYALTLISDDRVPYPGGGDDMFSNAVINPGTYLIKVDDDGNNAFNEDTYNFCVEFTANALELNQIYDEAAPIQADTCFEANIYGDNHLYTVYNDVDWFEVQIEVDNSNLEIAVTSVPDNLNMDVSLYQIIDNVLTLIADDGVPYPGGGEDMFVSADVNAGTYLISVEDNGNNAFNEETYTFCMDLIVDIDELSLFNQFDVFPNPNNGQFNINFLSENNDLKILEINIFDFLGGEKVKLQQNAFEGNEVSINIKNTASGLYLLRILTNKGIVTKKILVQ